MIFPYFHRFYIRTMPSSVHHNSHLSGGVFSNCYSFASKFFLTVYEKLCRPFPKVLFNFIRFHCACAGKSLNSSCFMSFPERFLQRRKPAPLPGHYQNCTAGSTMKTSTHDIIYNADRGTLGPVRTLAPDSSLAQPPRRAREEFINNTKNAGGDGMLFKKQVSYSPSAFLRRETTEGDGFVSKAFGVIAVTIRFSSGGCH